MQDTINHPKQLLFDFLISHISTSETKPVEDEEKVEYDIRFFLERIDTEILLYRQSSVLYAIANAAMEQSFDSNLLLQKMDQELDKLLH